MLPYPSFSRSFYWPSRQLEKAATLPNNYNEIPESTIIKKPGWAPTSRAQRNASLSHRKWATLLNQQTKKSNILNLGIKRCINSCNEWGIHANGWVTRLAMIGICTDKAVFHTPDRVRFYEFRFNHGKVCCR